MRAQADTQLVRGARIMRAPWFKFPTTFGYLLGKFHRAVLYGEKRLPQTRLDLLVFTTDTARPPSFPSAEPGVSSFYDQTEATKNVPKAEQILILTSSVQTTCLILHVALVEYCCYPV